jgi:hypothetical protein
LPSLSGVVAVAAHCKDAYYSAIPAPVGVVMEKK